MKKSFCTLWFTTLFALAFGAGSLFARDTASSQDAPSSQDVEARRAAFAQGFEQLMKNTEEGLAKPVVKEDLSKGGRGAFVEKFAIAPVTVPTTTTTTTACNLGVKVWFSLEDGTCFNPIKRKMRVKEKFYVHIQSAVPVYVSLFQNYPESRPESKQVYPDAKYPDTLKVIQAGVATKLPVAFEMDDDTRDEIMAMVVARADAPEIRSTLATQATTTVTTTDATTVVTAQATASTVGTMKSINDDLVGKGMDDPAKFAIAAPAVTTTTTATTVPNDVAFYMLGAGYVGQWQLTLKK
ncbi:MAG TPA: hypothetical protein DEB39_05000 [Planctomycetaceae bacterium]|nr:hypothetical protein [Planctomycetaceae bacterium]